MADANEAKLAHWAIVEIMGHRRLAGHVTEQTVAGAPLLRVDVPATESDPQDQYDLDGPTAPYTQLYGATAIFCLTPTDETTARRTARTIERGRQPVARRLSATTGGIEDIVDAEFEDGDDREDLY